MPRLMVRKLITQSNTFLNAFLDGTDVGKGLTPSNVIDNLPHVSTNDIKYEFGEYVQLHVTKPVTNTMNSRTIGAIVLDPRNITGKYNFMSLETGYQIDGRVVARLPITKAVIERVEELGKNQGQPYSMSKMLQYEWRPGIPMANDDMTTLGNTIDSDQLITPDPIVELPDPGPNPFVETPLPHESGAEENNKTHVATEVINQTEIVNQTETNQISAEKTTKNQGANNNNKNQGANNNNNNEEEIESDKEEENQDNDDQEKMTNDREDDSDDEDTDDDNNDDSNDTDDEELKIEQRRNEERKRRKEYWEVNTSGGRGKRTKKQTKRLNFLQKAVEKHGGCDQKKFGDLSEQERKDMLRKAWRKMTDFGDTTMMERYTTGVIFAQMSAKKGIEIYGEAAERKLIEEFAQFLDYEVFHGTKAEDLTRDEKKKALNMINLLEEKINRGHTPENPVLRARSVGDGRAQKGLYAKEQIASPTITLDALVLNCLIAAIEDRRKAVTDIKGAYLNAKMKDKVHMKITGPEVRIFCQLDPSLEEYVTNENGKEALYVRLNKALYGCVQSALLWYELYSTTLQDMGFVINPYDMCVANAEIDGGQCTISWYVDDNFITHKKEEVIDGVIGKLEEKFGEMSKTRGNDLEFLGMNLKFKKGQFTVNMKKHILKAFKDFGEEITRNAATPAKGYLFEVREGTKN